MRVVVKIEERRAERPSGREFFDFIRHPHLFTANGKDGVTRSTLKNVESCLELLANQPI